VRWEIAGPFKKDAREEPIEKDYDWGDIGPSLFDDLRKLAIN